jgi:hypothetical protein
MDESQVIVGLDPTTRPPGAGESRRAPRAPSLEGVVVATISNTKGRASAFLDAVYAELARTVSTAGRVTVEKSAVYAPPTDADWSRVRAAATVGITALGG